LQQLNKNNLLVEMVVDILQVNQTTDLCVLHEAGQLLAMIVERPATLAHIKEELSINK
jgi:hypothetical protein